MSYEYEKMCSTHNSSLDFPFLKIHMFAHDRVVFFDSEFFGGISFILLGSVEITCFGGAFEFDNFAGTFSGHKILLKNSVRAYQIGQEVGRCQIQPQ